MKLDLSRGITNVIEHMALYSDVSYKLKIHVLSREQIKDWLLGRMALLK